jgi:hypothetical protein
MSEATVSPARGERWVPTASCVVFKVVFGFEKEKVVFKALFAVAT